MDDGLCGSGVNQSNQLSSDHQSINEYVNVHVQLMFLSVVLFGDVNNSNAQQSFVSSVNDIVLSVDGMHMLWYNIISIVQSVRW
jgi:hypothetical protein